MGRGAVVRKEKEKKMIRNTERDGVILNPFCLLCVGMTLSEIMD